MTQMRCPVCSGRNLESFLSLDHQPVYQHPVRDPSLVPAPYFTHLTFHLCRDCGHAFQPDPDLDVLESIYRDYYYTPRPADIGVGFQDEFIDILDMEFDLLSRARQFLEIGCSGGEMIRKILQLYPGRQVAGFEPNHATAAAAGSSGGTIYPVFFTKKSSRDAGICADMIFHRHVIEHIADFDDFFDAHHDAAHPDTVLVIETPCLDRFARQKSMTPFHVEHLHVFSIHSLNALLMKFKWFLKDYRITKSGSMVGWFTRKPAQINIPFIRLPLDLSSWLEKNKKILSAAARGKEIAIWGAGSGGIKIVNYFNLNPSVIVDSNPEKTGRVFAGYGHLPVQQADSWLVQEISRSRSWLIVVASSYYDEITTHLKTAGWEGEIVKPYALSD